MEEVIKAGTQLLARLAELGADILNTAVAPSWEQVGLLAAIAAIRTGLNYFLQRELEHAADLERKQSSRVDAPGPPAR